jgi:MoaA/NifB/PqqE/SkfB family radical SAM enzyme|tara:strand:- start:1464 stop:2597 length:1134 start_codon:yes stop_codon:yes gene_type:complete
MDNLDNQGTIVRPRIYSADKVALENVVPLQTPFSAHIDVCSVCNFKCSFCFQADYKGMHEAGLKLGLMELNLFNKIVDDLSEFPQKLSKVKIGNHGEPTLHKLLPTFIEYVRHKNVADIVEVFTNGTKLGPELNRALVDAGLQRINISLEGLTSERYKEIAGVKMDMNKLIANIQDLFDYKNSVKGDLIIYIKIVDQVSTLNKEDDRTFTFTQDERDYFFNTYGPISDEIYIESIVPQWSQTQDDKQNIEVVENDGVERTGMYDQKIKNYKEICPFTFMYLHFNWEGTTSPCTLDWPKKVLIGNVKGESARDIWNGDKLAELQRAQLEGKRHKINFCNDCSAPMVCCDEYLDPHADAIREKMFPNIEKDALNQWVDQ